MDREAAVIREQMIHTRAELDRKITELESRARDLSPRKMAERHMPEFLLDRVVGGFLTLVGLKMALSRYRHYRHFRETRRERVRAAVVAHGRW